MDALTLQNKLIDQPDLIIKVLIATGIDENAIREVPSQHLIKAPRPDGDNPSGLLVYTNSLRVIGTTRTELTGNLFTLVMRLKNIRFPEALNFIAKEIGYDAVNETKIHYPFGGFYRKLIGDDADPEEILTEHSESELPSPLYISERFLKDNIPLITQEQWGVRYSFEEDAILIPIYSLSGKLVGCKARANYDVSDSEKRWWAYIKYPKTQVVYGLHQNYSSIISKRTLIVFESEKSVLQCAGYSCNNAVAVAGHSISKAQVKLIQGMMCDRIVVAFDEGLDEEEIEFETKKLKMQNHIISNKVGYVYDRDHDVLMPGSKDSPSDNGKEALVELLQKHTRWLK